MSFNLLRRMHGWFGKNDDSGRERPVPPPVPKTQDEIAREGMIENRPEELKARGIQTKPIKLNVTPLEGDPFPTPQPIEGSEKKG